MIALPSPFANIYAIVSFLFIVPTFCLYGIITYLVFYSPRRRYYQGPFYKMFVVATGVAFILTVGTYFQGHILGAPMFLSFVKSLPSTGIVPTFFLTILYYGIYAGELINCALAFNRFSIIILKQSYHFFWQKYFVLIVSITLVIPLLLVWQFSISNVQIYVFDDNDASLGYHLMDFNPPPWTNKSKIMTAVYAVTAVLSLLMNTITFGFLVQQKNAIHNSKDNKNDDSSPKNIRFFVFIMLTFVAETMTAVIQGLMNVIRYGTCTNPYLYTAQVLVSEFATLGPPWYLFFLSDELRSDMRRMFKKYDIPRVNATQSKVVTINSVKIKESK